MKRDPVPGDMYHSTDPNYAGWWITLFIDINETAIELDLYDKISVVQNSQDIAFNPEWMGYVDEE